MLVLSRKQDEVIEIGDGIRVMVVSIMGDKVRLGIEADRSIPVHRGEIAELIRQQQLEEQQACQQSTGGEE